MRRKGSQVVETLRMLRRGLLTFISPAFRFQGGEESPTPFCLKYPNIFDELTRDEASPSNSMLDVCVVVQAVVNKLINQSRMGFRSETDWRDRH